MKIKENKEKSAMERKRKLEIEREKRIEERKRREEAMARKREKEAAFKIKEIGIKIPFADLKKTSPPRNELKLKLKVPRFDRKFIHFVVEGYD